MMKVKNDNEYESKWLSNVLAGCMQNKGKTLVNFMKDLLGTILGKIIVTVYFLLWFMQMSMIARGMPEFMNLVLLHNTPLIVILLCILFLVSYASTLSTSRFG
jgi:spore germination protein KB